MYGAMISVRRNETGVSVVERMLRVRPAGNDPYLLPGDYVMFGVFFAGGARLYLAVRMSLPCHLIASVSNWPKTCFAKHVAVTDKVSESTEGSGSPV